MVLNNKTQNFQGNFNILVYLMLGGGRLFEVGANSRLGAYSNKYGIVIYRSGVNLV